MGLRPLVFIRAMLPEPNSSCCKRPKGTGKISRLVLEWSVAATATTVGWRLLGGLGQRVSGAKELLLQQRLCAWGNPLGRGGQARLFVPVTGNYVYWSMHWNEAREGIKQGVRADGSGDSLFLLEANIRVLGQEG